jgi:hypothetical protein
VVTAFTDAIGSAVPASMLAEACAGTSYALAAPIVTAVAALAGGLAAAWDLGYFTSCQEELQIMMESRETGLQSCLNRVGSQVDDITYTPGPKKCTRHGTW